MTSYAKFDVWQDTQGINYNAVLQVQFSIKTDTYVSSGTSNWSTPPGLSVNITPKFSTSKILLISQVDASGLVNTFGRYRRNGTVIGVGDASGNRSPSTSASWYYNNDGNTSKTMPMIFMDSPNSISLITYDIQLATPGSNSTYYVNRSYNDNDDLGRSRCQSMIIAMEIAQ